MTIIDIRDSHVTISTYGFIIISASYHSQTDETLFLLGRGTMFWTLAGSGLKYRINNADIYLYEV